MFERTRFASAFKNLLPLLLAPFLIAGLAGCDAFFVGDDKADHSATYRVGLYGANEVPPVETAASGHATLRVNRAGTAVRYRLSVKNIDDVSAAHIHLGGPKENGPVVAFLFDGPAVSVGDQSREIASGSIRKADLVGPLEGASFSQLVQAMRTGNAYVNVHTAANPAGEIRGQIDKAARE